MSARIEDRRARTVRLGDAVRTGLDAVWTVVFWVAFCLLPGIAGWSAALAAGQIVGVTGAGRLVIQIGLGGVAVLATVGLLLGIARLAEVREDR